MSAQIPVHSPTAQKLRQLLRDNGLEQRQLAKIVGVSPAMVCLWVSGTHRPKVHHLLKISEVFGVTVDSLLKGGSNGS